MGTNFYFKIKADMTINISIENEIKNIILKKMRDTLEELTEIHIGKRSGGWYPLFKRTQFYSSVKEIKEFYENNKDHLDIIDEYNNKYTMEELKDNLFDWSNDNFNARSHIDLNCGYYLDSEGYEFYNGEFS